MEIPLALLTAGGALSYTGPSGSEVPGGQEAMLQETVTISKTPNVRRKRRAQLSQRVRALADLIKEDAERSKDGLSYSVGGLQIDVSFCNGHMLMCMWEFDGREDYTLPWHNPNGAHEHISMVRGGEVFFEFESGYEKVLTSVGDTVYALPDSTYRVLFRARGGPAQGWLIIQPSDTDLVPRDDRGNCLLQPFGRCGGNPEKCLYKQLKTMLNDSPS